MAYFGSKTQTNKYTLIKNSLKHWYGMWIVTQAVKRKLIVEEMIAVIKSLLLISGRDEVKDEFFKQ